MELLVRTVARVNLNSLQSDCGLLKEGDVVTIQADGWPWTPAEQNNPEWRIIIVPDLTPADAELLTRMQPGDREANPYLLRREYFLVLDAMPLSSVILTSQLVISQHAYVTP